MQESRGERRGVPPQKMYAHLEIFIGSTRIKCKYLSSRSSRPIMKRLVHLEVKKPQYHPDALAKAEALADVPVRFNRVGDATGRDCSLCIRVQSRHLFFFWKKRSTAHAEEMRQRRNPSEREALQIPRSGFVWTRACDESRTLRRILSCPSSTPDPAH